MKLPLDETPIQSFAPPGGSGPSNLSAFPTGEGPDPDENRTSQTAGDARGGSKG